MLTKFRSEGEHLTKCLSAKFQVLSLLFVESHSLYILFSDDSVTPFYFLPCSKTPKSLTLLTSQERRREGSTFFNPGKPGCMQLRKQNCSLKSFWDLAKWEREIWGRSLGSGKERSGSGLFIIHFWHCLPYSFSSRKHFHPRDRQLIIIILCLRTLLAFCRHT